LPDLGGTADFAVIDPLNEAVIVDYKNGNWFVDTENNPQLKIYGLGVIGDGNPHMLETLTTSIVQPNCGIGEPIREAVYDVDNLLDWGSEVLKPAGEKAVKAKKNYELLSGIDDMQEWERAFLSSGDHCIWCRGKADCGVFTKNSVDDMFSEGELSLPNPMNLTIAEKFKIYAKMDSISAWLSAIREDCGAHLEMQRRVLWV
jgi:Protein of unknown function (DUF2800).